MTSPIQEDRRAIVGLTQGFFEWLMGRWNQHRSALGRLLLFTLLFGLAYSNRGQIVPGDSADAGWAYAAEAASTRGWLFGRDLLTNVGPLADFLLGVSLGLRYYWMVWLSLILAVAYVASLMWLTKAYPWWMRLPLLLWGVTSVVRWEIMIDAQIPIIALAVGPFWLEPHRPGWQRIFAWSGMAVLAMLALTKFTGFVIYTITFGLVCLDLFCRRRFIQSVLVALTSTALFAAAWSLSGQSLRWLPDYLLWNVQFGGTYAAATSLPSQSAWLVALGLALALILCGLLISHLVSSRARGWPTACLIACLSFILWKHGFTQIDGWHPIYFAVPATFFAIYLLGLAQPDWLKSNKVRSYLLVAMALIVVLMRSVIPYSNDEVATPWLYKYAQRLSGLPGELKKVLTVITSSPYKNYTLGPEAIDPTPLPKISALVGQEGVDALGNLQSSVLTKRPAWHYQPRPVFQSLLALNQRDMERNQHFLVDQTPTFLLARTEPATLKQYPFAMDSLVWNYALRHYAPVEEEKGYVLLKRQSSAKPPLEILYEIQADTHSPIAFDLEPDLQKAPLWLSIEIERNWMGKLVGFFFQFQNLTFTTLSDSPQEARERHLTSSVLTQTYVMAPENWQYPVLIQPGYSYFSSMRCFWDYTESCTTLKRLSIGIPHPWAFRGTMTLRFYRYPREHVPMKNAH